MAENKPNPVLDLDELQPEGNGSVKLGGKEYKVFPPKVKSLAKLSKLSKKFDDTLSAPNLDPNESLDLIDELVGVLSKVMPGFAEDDVDLNLAQAYDLLQYAMSLTMTDEQRKQVSEMTAERTPVTSDQMDAPEAQKKSQPAKA